MDKDTILSELKKYYENYITKRGRPLSKGSLRRYVNAGRAVLKRLRSLSEGDIIQCVLQIIQETKATTTNHYKMALRAILNLQNIELTEKTKQILKSSKIEYLKDESCLIDERTFANVLSAIPAHASWFYIMVSMIYDAGFRPNELCLLKIKDVIETPYGYDIHVPIDTKTGERVTYLKDSVSTVRLWLQNHPDRENQNAPFLFHRRTPGGIPAFIAESTPTRTWGRVRDTLKGRGISLNHRLYDLRHTAITRYRRKPFASDALCKQRFGWVQSSAMLNTYTHITNDMAKEAEFEHKPDKSDKQKRCPNCDVICSAEDDYCSKCGFPISESAELQELERRLEKENEERARLREENELLKKKFMENEKRIRRLERVLENIDDVN